MAEDLPVALLLAAAIGVAIWLVTCKTKAPAAKPGAPAGEPFLPLAPSSVAPAMRWLLLPSQEE